MKKQSSNFARNSLTKRISSGADFTQKYFFFSFDSERERERERSIFCTWLYLFISNAINFLLIQLVACIHISFIRPLSPLHFFIVARLFLLNVYAPPTLVKQKTKSFLYSIPLNSLAFSSLCMCARARSLFNFEYYNILQAGNEVSPPGTFSEYSVNYSALGVFCSVCHMCGLCKIVLTVFAVLGLPFLPPFPVSSLCVKRPNKKKVGTEQKLRRECRRQERRRRERE